MWHSGFKIQLQQLGSLRKQVPFLLGPVQWVKGSSVAPAVVYFTAVTQINPGPGISAGATIKLKKKSPTKPAFQVTVFKALVNFFFLVVVFVPFLGSLPWHMEVPRLEV